MAGMMPSTNAVFQAQLRPYQSDAVESLLQSAAAGEHPVCALPTGSGKSLVIAALCRRLPGRILVVAHRQELLEQDATALRCVAGDDDHGIYSAGLARREGRHRVVFGGIQSIYRRMDLLQHPGAFGTIIVDECHRTVPPSQQSMYRTVFEACPSATRIGLTATPYRLDSGLLHQGNDTWFTAMPVQVGLLALTPQYLSPLVGVLTAHDIDVSQVRINAGEYVARDLSQAACEETAVQGALDELCTLAQHRQAWVLFCVDVAHTRLVHYALTQRGIAAGMLLGTTEQEDRRATLRAFREGELRALVNCQVATTGFDIPRVDCLALLRPTLSKGLCVQMIGRGTRHADGKMNCLILDFSGNLERHRPLDEVPVTVKSPAREAADEQAAQRRDAFRAREAKHAQEATRIDPWTEAEGPRDLRYRVLRVAYALVPSKQRPGKTNLVVRYRCHAAGHAPRWVSQWLCVEYGGWARAQALPWFERRGLPAPQTAQEALWAAKRAHTPAAILVRPDGKWDRLLLEYFEEEGEESKTPELTRGVSRKAMR